MVVGAFPLAKLGALLLRQISKPIANALKNQAKASPVFSKYVCLPPAQFYNWCEIKAKMWILNLGKPVNITVLSEESAIELGANLLGEAIIFIVACGVLVFEYNRSSRNDAAKETARIRELEIINSNLKELFLKTEEHGVQIKHLTRVVNELESGVVKKPWIPKKKSEDLDKEDFLPKSDLPAGFIPIPVPTMEEAESPKLESSVPSFKNLALKPSVIKEVKPSYLKDIVVTKTEIPENEQEKNPKIEHRNQLLKIASQVEKEMFSDVNNKQERQTEGIVLDALNYLYKEVFKMSGSN